MHATHFHDDVPGMPYRFIAALLFSLVLHAGAVSFYEVDARPVAVDRSHQMRVRVSLVRPVAQPKAKPVTLRTASIPKTPAKPEKVVRRVHKPAPEPPARKSPPVVDSGTAEPLTVTEKHSVPLPATYQAPTLQAVRYLHNPPPPYPRHARRLRLEGKVLLQAHVLASGQAVQIRLEQSSGHSLLDDAALDVVRGWHFLPAKRGDEFIASWVEIPVHFRFDR